jgi:hypothetical protein
MGADGQGARRHGQAGPDHTDVEEVADREPRGCATSGLWSTVSVAPSGHVGATGAANTGTTSPGSSTS